MENVQFRRESLSNVANTLLILCHTAYTCNSQMLLLNFIFYPYRRRLNVQNHKCSASNSYAPHFCAHTTQYRSEILQISNFVQVKRIIYDSSERMTRNTCNSQQGGAGGVFFSESFLFRQVKWKTNASLCSVVSKKETGHWTACEPNGNSIFLSIDLLLFVAIHLRSKSRCIFHLAYLK